jgi:uncharacterized membrane protein
VTSVNNLDPRTAKSIQYTLLGLIGGALIGFFLAQLLGDLIMGVGIGAAWGAITGLFISRPFKKQG